jgi:hypothetical protein
MITAAGWGEANSELGTVYSRQIRYELRNFWCADTDVVIRSRFNFGWKNSLHVWQAELCRLTSFVVSQHIRLHHQNEVCVGIAEFGCIEKYQ